MDTIIKRANMFFYSRPYSRVRSCLLRMFTVGYRENV